MIEKRCLNAIRVLPAVKGIETEWLDQIIRDDGSIAASTPWRRAYGQFDRDLFLTDMAGESAAVTYADLAGLEIRSVVVEPATTEPELVTK